MPGSEFVKSVQRALDIVQAVGDSDGGISLTELAKSLGVNTTTVHNLVRTLTVRGFLEKTEKPVRYKIGPAFQEITRRSNETGFLDHAGLVIRELARKRPDVTWTLVQKVGSEFLVRLRISPEQGGVLQKPEHRSMSPFSSASALIFQAFLSPDELDLVYERYPFDEYGQHQWRSREKFNSFLKKVRQKGYAAPGSKDGRLIMAAPVFIGAHQVTAALGAALSCSGGDLRWNEKEIARDLLAAAERLGKSPGADDRKRR